MKNIEKLRELKDYQLVRILDLLCTHLFQIHKRKGSIQDLDVIDFDKDSENIQLSWLNSEYSERVGFRFLTHNGLYFAKPEDIKPPRWFDPKDEQQLSKMVIEHDYYMEEPNEYDCSNF